MVTFKIWSSPHFPRSHATPEVVEPPTGDWDGVAPVFRGFMDQFTLVYAQIRWQMTQFSVRVQSVTRFCVESEILDMAQLISTPSPSQTEAHPPPKPILVITLGRALLRFDQGQLIFARKFTNFCGICVFRWFQDFWTLVWELTNVKRLRRDKVR